MAKRLKGVILAGGTGSRLYPLTKVTNKHLLPVYDKPMIYYPLETLKKMGCKDIMIVSGREHCGDILNLLGSGRDMGVRLSYEIQDEAGGIAHALGLAERFVGTSNVAVCLGDNIFDDEIVLDGFEDGARIFLTSVHDPERFGVAELEKGTECKVISIEEKPKNPKSNFCVTGLYVYDNKVFNYIKNLTPSDRGELEITDVNNFYVKDGLMTCQVLKSWWSDAGTFESLLKASSLVAKQKLCSCESKNVEKLPKVSSNGEYGDVKNSER
jgi:glucose-1-phosphate thymidylyltransferase|tara:strand:- start:520 stop:1326 length:807 start_codon:yes stop_codon:yes gene_type:complete